MRNLHTCPCNLKEHDEWSVVKNLKLSLSAVLSFFVQKLRREMLNFVQDPYLDRKSLGILNYQGYGFDYRLEIVTTLSDKIVPNTMQLLNYGFPEGSPLDIMYESGIWKNEFFKVLFAI